MNLRLSRTLAAALASTAALAIAQVPAEPGAATQPTPEQKPAFTQEPVASAGTGGSGPHAARANAIVEALNAERSLQGSKFSVLPTENGVFLSGVTSSLRQMTQAVKLAEQHGGGAPVISSVSTEEVVIDAGAVAPDAQSMVSADEARAASEQHIAARPQAAPPQ